MTAIRTGTAAFTAVNDGADPVPINPIVNPVGDRHAEQICELAGPRDPAVQATGLADIIRGRQPHAASLLQIECGTGIYLEHFATLFARVHGADGSLAMTNLARLRLPQVQIHHARPHDLALDEVFDAVVCLFSSAATVLRGFQDLSPLIGTLAAHTRPGGVVIVEPWMTPARWRLTTPTSAATLEVDPSRPICAADDHLGCGHATIHFQYLCNVFGPSEAWRMLTEDLTVGCTSLLSDQQYQTACTQAGLREVQWLAGWRPGHERLVATKPMP